jgi:hypothetical protein
MNNYEVPQIFLEKNLTPFYLSGTSGVVLADVRVLFMKKLSVVTGIVARGSRYQVVARRSVKEDRDHQNLYPPFTYN